MRKVRWPVRPTLRATLSPEAMAVRVLKGTLRRDSVFPWLVSIRCRNAKFGFKQNTRRFQASIAFACCHWRRPGRLALFKGEGDSPLAGDAPALQHVLIAFWLRRTNYSYVAPSTKKISCFETRSLPALPRRYLAALPSILEIPFLNSCVPDSFGVRSRVRYCTVTSVPTGISEKNLRAVSSGNRMQPCDAG